jgi:hypothetical protein
MAGRPGPARVYVPVRLDAEQVEKLDAIAAALGLAGRERATDTGRSAAIRAVIDAYPLADVRA